MILTQSSLSAATTPPLPSLVKYNWHKNTTINLPGWKQSIQEDDCYIQIGLPIGWWLWNALSTFKPLSTHQHQKMHVSQSNTLLELCFADMYCNNVINELQYSSNNIYYASCTPWFYCTSLFIILKLWNAAAVLWFSVVENKQQVADLYGINLCGLRIDQRCQKC